MKVAIVGAPSAGKTTFFCALSGIEYEKAIVGLGQTKKLSAAIRVEDQRLITIKNKGGNGRKIVTPLLEILDTPPITNDNKEAINSFREVDGLVAIVKLYENNITKDNLNEAFVKEQENIRSELFISDLELLERRRDKLKSQANRPSQFTEENKRELEAAEFLVDKLPSGGISVFDKLNEGDKKRLSSFGLFSQKPTLFIGNISENLLDNVNVSNLLLISLKLEFELKNMQGDEKKEFMKSYNLEKLSIEDLPIYIYHHMGYSIFITIGKNDITGWGFRTGSEAVEAAGKIHTDISKGFIAAEVVSYDDWLKYGGVHEAATKAKLRTEGKTYKVKDGDIVNFRFNV